MAESTGAPLAARHAVPAGNLAFPEPLVIVVIGAVALGITLRAIYGAGFPLWLDETFTGALAAEETFGQAVQQSLLEANAPLYSIFMYLWSQLFGLSNGALRAPAFLFGAAAPLIALIPAKGIGRETRLIWCALAALWIPALWYSQEARCYTLLLCLAMGSTVAYARLLATPGTRRAAIWAGIGTLAILTHYHALLLIGLQGLGYLAAHRARALRTWPAALFFLPALAWIWLQLPRILQFADPDATWYALLSFTDGSDLLNFILGDIAMAGALALIIMIPVIVRREARPSVPIASEGPPADLWIVVGTAALGAVIVIILGAVRPSFTMRYLMPFMPGILLGFAYAIWRFGRRWTPAPIAILLIAAAAAVASQFEKDREGIKFYNFQAASHALMASDAKRLVFLWDNPVARIYDPSQLDAAGAFFFRREGKPVAVVPVYLKPNEDPNRLLLSTAREPGSAILWLYDVNVRATAARWHPPRIEQLDPAWRCTDFGRGPFGVIACHRPPASLSWPGLRLGPQV